MTTITATVESIGPHAMAGGGSHSMSLQAVKYNGRLFFLGKTNVYVNGKGVERCRLFVISADKAAKVRAGCVTV